MLDRRARRLAVPFLLALAQVLVSLPGEARPNGAAGALRGRPALVREGVHVLDARALGGLGRAEPGTAALVFEPDGLLKSGLLVRVLVLPNNVAGVAESLAWIASIPALSWCMTWSSRVKSVRLKTSALRRSTVGSTVFASITTL